MSRIPANQSEIWCYGRSRINRPFIPKRLQTCYRGGPLAFEPYEGKLSRTVPLGGKPDATKGPTYPNREYAGICEKQHLTMFMTNRIPTYR